ncbi:Ureidoglycolate lyase [Arthrobacter sp. Bi83]|uniref:fumarylacetoacetate hydrolase family protein n=1 Tax=Arthrobacter sp. Bi83 TaxID=2822353 RepID=UPI001D74D3F6|nr:fumarylacetoacetate hydrolase family protein [Arthrobacter sp. Bi83]CAH0276360.1 Ureidoglycolate lyase [Arthrobacter sp. Bi83]
MRLMRIGTAGNEIPVIIDDEGQAYDLRPVTADIDGGFLQTWAGQLDELDLTGLPRVAMEGKRIGAPIARPGAVIGVGLNYAAHAAESGLPLPERPIIFFKHPNTVVGPNDDVVIPPGAQRVDWEVELGVVIGQQASYLKSDTEAAACIAGFVLSNDVSEREYQLEHSGPQWSLGKSCPTFNPVGPWLVPATAANAGAIELASWVNGEPRQKSSTQDMVFGPAELVRRLSQYMVLEPGDLITTGTPAGVALSGRFPYLRAGDVMRMSGGGLLGEQRQRLVDAAAPA